LPLALGPGAMDLTSKLAATETNEDLPGLQAGFVKAAKGYREHKGISCAAWREVGVHAAVLNKPGVGR
jgi:hypothetical protein